jgi:peptidoglycan/xylan/chitin deacetylase (PgdA/CDA1 family)
MIICPLAMKLSGTLAKSTIKRLTATSLGWSAAGRLRRPGVLILAYHRIAAPGDRFPGLDVSVFRAQMEWLASHCRPISPDQLRDAVAAAPAARPPVLVTFDDGYLSYRERAYPILREFGIPGLLFLTTAYVDDPTRLFWWDVLRASIEESSCRSVELPWSPGATLALDGPESRGALLSAAKEHLKGVSGKERDKDVAELLARLGAENPVSAGGRQMLDWDDVKAILDGTHIGGHSHTHPIMSKLTDEELEVEVATCCDRIRAVTGITPRWFAYPNGRACDFDDRARAALRRHGFEAAFASIGGVAGPDVDWMALPRFAGDGTVADLAWRLSVRARH